MTIFKLTLSLLGYGILLYIVSLTPFYLYTPVRSFDLPNLLWLTHLLLLYIHEAGHLIFSLFGRTLSILGGSLNQVLIPVLWYVAAKREGSSLANAAITLTGVSIIDVSVYVKDAGLLQLPLLGGLSKSHHDWATLLNDWGVIEHSYAMGEVLFWSGFIMAGAGIVSGVREALHRYRRRPAP